MKFETMTKQEVITAFEFASTQTKNSKTLTAYRRTVKIVTKVEFIECNARRTPLGAVNGGDVIEAVTSELLGFSCEVSAEGEKDLDRTRYREVKAFMQSNRGANGMSELIGFIAVTPNGAYEIPFRIWKLYKEEIYKVNQIRTALINELIRDYNLHRLSWLSSELGL